MENDIIAANQTAAAISKLRRGEATDALRDEVSAALLSSIQTILKDLEDVKRNLWSPQVLKATIDERHVILCNNCPTKKWVESRIAAERAVMAPEKSEERKGWFHELVHSEPIRYFFLVVLLVWAVIYIKTGVDGVNAVRDAAVHTMTGGVK